MKYLDDSLEKIKADLKFRDREGRKRDISVTHRDFIKACVSLKRIITRWIELKMKLLNLETED